MARPRLLARLNEGLSRKLTLISAPAGFGKTTLVSTWVAACQYPVAWLSLDSGDNDPVLFLTYFVNAIQTIAPSVGQKVLALLQSPQPPPPDFILTALLNDLASAPEPFVVVLDDYHVIEAKPINEALGFLIENLPPHIHLVLVTREDPTLALGRLRAYGQLTELRATDLRFTLAEAAGFLNQVMGLSLSEADIAALETRTEGWIAGLQLAALSMQGHKDIAGFIKSFTGSHHYVMDYLVEEVLQLQPGPIQSFLLHTSILDRLCGPLCEAVVPLPEATGQTTLAQLERANLFIIPLDNERKWYRYHHLFAELLRQRLPQSFATTKLEAEARIDELHLRASHWYEANDFEQEAILHAAAANDIDRAESLIEKETLQLYSRGFIITLINWLDSLPVSIMEARPTLRWRHASLLLVNGHTTGVEEKLLAAEAALPNMGTDAATRKLIGRIAAARATVALTHYDTATMIAQSERALDYLPLEYQSLRASAYWTMGFAYLMLKDQVASRKALTETIALSQPANNVFTIILATIGLGNVHEIEAQLYQAADTYRQVLKLAGDQPLQIVHEAHQGLARLAYEWNDLATAEHEGQQSLQLAKQYDSVIDRFILAEIFLAQLKLAQGDVEAATAMLAQTNQSAQQPLFRHRLPDVAAIQVLVLLQQGNLTAAAHLAETYPLPISQARVHLAQGDPVAALALLEPLRAQAEAKNWLDDRLKIMVLQARALYQHGDKAHAIQTIADCLPLAEQGGYLRLFLDEGPLMAQLVADVAAQGLSPDYTAKVLAAFEAQASTAKAPVSTASLVEPLSQRELEILQLVAQGLSNQEISERLFLALSTVKGHNQTIFGKLQVERRTEAVARARELGLL